MHNLLVRATRRLKREVNDRTLPLNPAPLVFLGKGKSGTTAIAALFAEATDRSVALDIPALFVDGLRPILKGEKRLSDVVRRQRIAFSKDILKQPTLTWVYPQLRDIFSKGRFVMIVRDPRDNIRSVLNRMEIPGTLDRLSDEQVSRIHPGWRWHFSEPELLELDGANYIEQSAHRWNKAVDIYFAHRDEMELIRYEDFMADRGGFITRLADDLGWPVVKDITPLLDTQFQPRGKDRGGDRTAFFGARNLETINRICGSRMAMLGYSADDAPAVAATPSASR